MGGGGPAAAGRMLPDRIFPLLPCCESDDEDELFLCFLSVVVVVVVVVVVPEVVVVVVVPPVGSDEFAVVPDVPLVVVLPLCDSSSVSDDVEVSSVELSVPSTDTSSTCGFTGLGSGGATMATTGGPRGGTGFAGLAPFHGADAATAMGEVAFGPPAATTTVDVFGLSFESPDEVVPVVPLPEVVVVPVVVPEVVPDVLVVVVVVVADSSSLDESSSLLLLTSFTSGCFPLEAGVEVGPVAALDATVLGAGGFRGGGCSANELTTTADVLTALGG